MRVVRTPYAAVDAVLVLVLLLSAPVGWLAGRSLYASVCQLIPTELRSYPVAAMMWSAVATGVPLLMLVPLDGSLHGFALAWVVSQLPAAFLAAGMYGILEGWLAVDGARDWWPMSPPPQVEEVDFGAIFAQLPPPPTVFDVHEPEPPGERTPIRREDKS